MKRVLLTCHKFFPAHRAGTEVLTLRVAQELQKRGYDVLVVTADPPDLDARHKEGPETYDYEHEGVPVHAIGEALRLKGYTFKHEFYHPEIRKDFEQVLSKFRPDMVHIFHVQNLSASIVDAVCEQGLPVVLSATDFWFVCPIVQLKKPDGQVCRGPALGGMNCLTCYTPRLLPPLNEFVEAFDRKYPRTLTSLPPPYARACSSLLYGAYALKKAPQAIDATLSRPEALRKAANRMSAIMVPTRLMLELFVENGINSQNIHHVPFGLDTDPLLPYVEKSASSSLRVGFIGTIFEHKGVDLLVEAFARLPVGSRAELKIYGDLEQFPEYGARLRALAEGSPAPEKIKFCGTFPNQELGKVLSAIDVLVVPSRWYENTPLVIQSALATKTPVIATDLGGMSELIHDGINGFLFPLNDSHALKEKLSMVLDDPEWLARLRASIPPERTTAQMVDDIERIYMLADNRSGSKGDIPAVAI